MKQLLFLVVILFSQSLVAQQLMKLTGHVNTYPNQEFMLLAGDEGGVFVVDKATSTPSGDLTFEWEGESGFYRVVHQSEYFDLRIAKKNLHFTLSGTIDDGELSFPGQDENNQYQYYLSEFKLLNQSIEDISYELKDLNEKEVEYKELNAELKKVKREKRSMLRDLWVNKMEESWSARFAVAQQELLPDVKLIGKKAKDYHLKHFFDYFAFSDSLLVGTPIYYEKIGKYLKAQQFEELIASGHIRKVKEVVGTLFWFTELNPDSQKYLANYLMSKYSEKEYNQVYHIIADAYKVLNTCEYVINSREVQLRIQNSKNIDKGWIVPDAELYHSKDGRVQSLSSVNSELTLFVIWSGSCPHSIEMLNRIREIYDTYKELGLEVVAVSLDKNLQFWDDVLDANNFPWINACDTDGLGGTIAKQFNVYVTPSMFLIDQSLKTVAVPLTFFQLEKELTERFR